jgi:hypothetical protein
MAKIKWDLEILLAEHHKNVHGRLEAARRALKHPVTKGDASENVWISLFEEYLPKRYQTAKATIVDCNGKFSEQIDVVIYDRQYSPLIITIEGQKIIPAESVYAVFESKQEVTASDIAYTQGKIKSVRRLERTTLAIPYVQGKYAPKPLHHIIGGILTFESGWKPPIGKSLKTALETNTKNGLIDIGCIAANGYFCYNNNKFEIVNSSKAVTAFLFALITQLQSIGTVPMMDISKYAKWLGK